MCFFLLSLGESLFRSLAHFLLDCKGSFYILDISPLLYMWFAEIFSQFVACLCISSEEHISKL